MKKILQNVLFRALSVLIFGILLLLFSNEMTRWIVYASGGLFALLGGIALIGTYRNRKGGTISIVYPLVAIGSLLFGVVQLLLPNLFFGVLRYLMSGLISFLAAIQFYSLIVMRKGGIRVQWPYFLMPLVGIGAALFVMLYEGFVENDPKMMMLLGILFILYAVLELWTLVLVRRKPVGQQQESELREISR